MRNQAWRGTSHGLLQQYRTYLTVEPICSLVDDAVLKALEEQRDAFEEQIDAYEAARDESSSEQ